MNEQDFFRNPLPFPLLTFSTFTQLLAGLAVDGQIGRILTNKGVVGIWGRFSGIVRPLTKINLAMVPAGDPGGVFTPQLSGVGTGLFDGSGLLTYGGRVFMQIAQAQVADCVTLVAKADILNASSTNGSRAMPGLCRSTGNPMGFGIVMSGGASGHGVCYGPDPASYSRLSVGLGAIGNGVLFYQQIMRLGSGDANSSITSYTRATTSASPIVSASSPNGVTNPNGCVMFDTLDAGPTGMQSRWTEVFFDAR